VREEQRPIDRRDAGHDPSNLMDAKGERLKPVIPKAAPGGRPRKTDMPAAMNATFSSLRAGGRNPVEEPLNSPGGSAMAASIGSA
jgi:hypothetical protein